MIFATLKPYLMKEYYRRFSPISAEETEKIIGKL